MIPPKPLLYWDAQNSVLDKDLTGPPGGESEGDRYIIAAVATGAWAGRETQIADYRSGTWEFTVVDEGAWTEVEDENKIYLFDGAAWNEYTPVPGAHAASHQNGGADEVNVAALSGELADDQPPKDHAAAHQNGGGDEISVAALSGLLADDQHVLDAEAVAAVEAAGIAIATTMKLAFDDGGDADIIRDEDNMASNDEDALATQQSIKAYTDTKATAAEAVAAVEAAGLEIADQKFIEYEEASLTDDKASGECWNGITAGENVAFPDLCYFKNDGKMWKVDADAVATTKGLLGIALETINAESTGRFLLMGWIRDDNWTWTIGGLIYASVTGGALSQTAPVGSGDIVRIVGYAVHADRMRFCPDNTYIEIA